MWSVKATTGDAPKAMSSRGAVSGNNLLVFGGVLHGEAQDTLHCLDMSKCVMYCVELCGTYTVCILCTCVCMCVYLCVCVCVYLCVCVCEMWFGSGNRKGLVSILYIDAVISLGKELQYTHIASVYPAILTGTWSPGEGCNINGYLV